MPSLRAPRMMCALAAVLATVGCGSSGAHHSLLGDSSPVGAPAGSQTTVPTTIAAATTTIAAPTTQTAAPTTAAAPSVPARPYTVGTTSLDLTDSTRNAGSHLGRHLPTLVFYPAVGPNPAAETAGVAGIGQAWPLVVFAHGYNVTPLTYHDLLHHLAEQGFVVAAPSFPLETAGGPLDENDLGNEPADISFVISQVLAASNGSGVLTGMIDPAKIAVVGHSDGGEAALAIGFLPSDADTRVGPVVAMAAQAILNGDHIAAASTRHPLLVVQGSADTINPPARSDRVFATAPSPKAYLRLLGAGHLPPIADNNQWRPVVEATVVDWLDAWFSGPNRSSAAARLGHDADVPGTSSVQLG